MIKTIIATGTDYSIGKDNKLLWHYKEDLRYFQSQTKNSIVVMGRKTHDSIKAITKHPAGLPSRYNYVLSHSGKGVQLDEYIIINDKEAVLHLAEHTDVWVIGGSSVYEMFKDVVDEVHWTTINKTYDEADCHFDMGWVKCEDEFEKVSEQVLCEDVIVNVYKRK